MKNKYIGLLILCGLLLTACGPSATVAEPTPDVAAVRTSAASTVEAKFTLTAAAFTPTFQPALPTETDAPEPIITDTPEPTEEGLCDVLAYIEDVNVPDNTVMSPGQDFIKTWRVQNTGACPWGAGYVLTYAGYSDQMSGQFIALEEVIQPGQEVEVSVQFKAPDATGEYLSAWSMRNPQGVTFPEVIFVKIIVQ
jgi:hypothetical protein